MKTHLDIEKLIESGSILNELDYERALVADRKLRLLAREKVHFKNLRAKLRNIIEDYEKLEWNKMDNVTDEKLVESDKAEIIAEGERLFIEKRKHEIKKRLRSLHMTQEDLAILLGHKSKTHMSELINGIKPFKLKDLIIINRILKIEIDTLLPIYLTKEDYKKIREAVKLIDNPRLKLSSTDLVIA